MKKITLLIALVSFHTSYLLASPGGKIVKELFDSPQGKLFLFLMTIILLPWVIRHYYRNYKAKKATKKILLKLAQIDVVKFDELALNNRVTDVFRRVHTAWSNQDLEACSEFMSNWYQQNQQTVFLDEWKKKRQMNVCTIEQINSVEPIQIRVSNNSNFDQTRIIYTISAKMEDYLINIEDSAIIEGKKGFREVETIWTMVLIDSVWKVDNIEQADMLSKYLKMDNLIPDNLLALQEQRV